MNETNLAAAVLAAAEQLNKNQSTSWQHIAVIITAATPFLLAVMVWLQNRTHAVVKEIKTDTNGNTVKLSDELKIMHGAFVDVAKENAVYKEQKRVDDAAVAAAAVVKLSTPKVDLSDLRAILQEMVAVEVKNHQPDSK